MFSRRQRAERKRREQERIEQDKDLRRTLKATLARLELEARVMARKGGAT
jgi:hypothetical protein